MSDHPTSLLLTGGRVLDPASGLDATADVLVEDGVAEPCVHACSACVEVSRRLYTHGYAYAY